MFKYCACAGAQLDPVTPAHPVHLCRVCHYSCKYNGDSFSIELLTAAWTIGEKTLILPTCIVLPPPVPLPLGTPGFSCQIELSKDEVRAVSGWAWFRPPRRDQGRWDRELRPLGGRAQGLDAWGGGEKASRLLVGHHQEQTTLLRGKYAINACKKLIPNASSIAAWNKKSFKLHSSWTIQRDCTFWTKESYHTHRGQAELFPSCYEHQ